MYIYTYVYMYMYIYIYICIRGNHLSNTTCLTRFLQKWGIMQQNALAVLDK